MGDLYKQVQGRFDVVAAKIAQDALGEPPSLEQRLELLPTPNSRMYAASTAGIKTSVER